MLGRKVDCVMWYNMNISHYGTGVIIYIGSSDPLVLMVDVSCAKLMNHVAREKGRQMVRMST